MRNAARRDRRHDREPDETPTDVAERPLPQDLEVERLVLGSILMRGAMFETAFGVLSADDFYRDAHRRIFSAMEDLDEAGTPIEYVTLKDRLAKTGDLTAVGGPVYITALVDGVPKSANIEHYAQIVKEKATLRGLVAAANKMLTDVYESDEPAETLLGAADRAIVDLQTSRASTRMCTIASRTHLLMNAVEESAASRGRLLGLDTGFPGLNDLTLGWQRGDMIVIAARPSIGKTTFALNSAIAGASDKRVAVFSLEMRVRQLEYRILSSMSGIPLTRLMLGTILGDEEYAKLSAALGRMANLRFAINDRGGQPIEDIRADCRRLKADGGLDLVVVDHFQLMPGSLGRRNATRNEELTDVSRRLKELADDCGVPVLVLSQLNRTSSKADNRPTLRDLRDTGALEQDADVVVFLHRRHHRENGYTAFIVEKQRMGPGGTLALTLDRDIVTFTDGGEEPPPPRKKGE